MSDVLNKAVDALKSKFENTGFGSTVRFDIAGEGSVMVDGTQAPLAVAPGDGDADVVISADLATFRGLMDGDLNPTGAYMSGRLKIDGDMTLAMKLASLLA